MLLRVPVTPDACDAENRACESPLGHGGAESAATVAVANGRVSKLPSFLLERYPTAELNVYIHPGRSGLGKMSSDQAGRQFDWQNATFHPTLGQAELAAEKDIGFLVEVVGAFEDGEGRSCQGGAFFVPLNARDLPTKG